MKKSILYLAILVINIFLSTGILFSSPTIIQDNRVTNLGTTPVLGRGYSVATNTYQSTCLTNIETTVPSYDFTYSFKDMNDFLSENISEDNYISRIANTAYRNYLQKKEQDAGIKSEQGTTEKSSDEELQIPAKTGVESSGKKAGREIKRIMVNIQLDSYYASVDESKTKLSDSASKLITNNDITGFFNSCGAYYIRSIRRNALFISIFEFESISEKEDKEFVYQLESELKSFRKAIIEPAQKQATVEAEQSGTAATPTGKSSEKKDTYSKSAEKRNLTITAAAFGLGKNEKATLISYDIDSFKAAIKDAFMAMQNPMTGKVIAIEVVPWIENTEFQTLIKLEEPVTGYNVTTEDRKSVIKKSDKQMLMYEKKYILNLNAEFLAEIERVDRSMMNIFYKAKICRKFIDSNWKTLNGGNLVFKPEYADRYVMNNRQNNTGIKLLHLDSILTTQKINEMLNDHREFMYGGGKWGAGMSSCINNIMKYGIFRLGYRNIEDCTKLEENFAQVEDEIIENHCMPVLFNTGMIPDNKIGQPKP
jgi:hypothetical protein